jgi:NitT/TauT family transport system permease protein
MRRYALPIFSLIFFVLLWYLLVAAAKGGIFSIPGFRLSDIPGPVEVASAFVHSLFTQTHGPIISYGIIDHSVASLWRVFLGLLIASAIGIPLGVLIGYWRWAEDILNPVVEVLRQIPPIAWIPLAVFIMVYGADIFLVFIGIVFPVMLSTIHGVKSVDPRLIDAAKTLGAGSGEMIRKVVLPSAIPEIISGLRIGLGVGWMCIVAAEMVIQVPTGLGYFIWNQGNIGRYEEMVCGMLLIGLIGFLMNFLILSVEKRLVPWH